LHPYPKVSAGIGLKLALYKSEVEYQAARPSKGKAMASQSKGWLKILEKAPWGAMSRSSFLACL
jgi:hypothetical protein